MRHVHWPQRLSAICEEWRQRPYDWNGSCCVTFAGDCVWAITGVDPIKDLRGRYSTKRGALRVLANEGHSCLADMVATRFTECRIDQLQRGDLAVFPGKDGDFIGVVLGHYAVAPHGRGLIQVNLSFAERGFKI